MRFINEQILADFIKFVLNFAIIQCDLLMNKCEIDLLMSFINIMLHMLFLLFSKFRYFYLPPFPNLTLSLPVESFPHLSSISPHW